MLSGGLLCLQNGTCFCLQERLFRRGTDLHVQGSQVKKNRKQKTAVLKWVREERRGPD